MGEPARCPEEPSLFSALQASWPAAECLDFGPWRLRRGQGGGRRASAATLEAPFASPEPAQKAMRAWGQRPLFLVREGETQLDAALAEQGYRVEAPSLFHAGPAKRIAHRAADLAVIDCDGPIAIAADLWRSAGIGPERLAVMARVRALKRVLLGRLEDRPAGAGFVSLHGNLAMLNALFVADRVRRRGLGRRMVQWAAAWAVENGADTLALAVEEANMPARALYEALGMAPAGGYHYRVAPEEDLP